MPFTRQPAMRQKVTTAYRLDFRSPDIILKEGFWGAKNTWMNNIFEGNTVFAAKSLRGISRFFLGAVKNKNVDGSNSTGDLSKVRNLYPESNPCFVYKLNIALLDYIDVTQDICNVMDAASNSRLLRYRHNKIRAAHPDLSNDELDDYFFSSALILRRYSNVVKHTEEIIIKGPILPNRITLYTQL